MTFMRIILFFIAMVFFGAAMAASAEPVKIQHWSLKNGANVYYVHSAQVPIVDIEVVFAAGSAYDGSKPGIASLVNSLLNQGSKQHNADQISDAFDSVGAQVGAGVDQDMAMVSLRCLTSPKYFQPALDMFSEIINAPSFPTDALSRVKNQTVVGIEMDEQTPSQVASKAFYKLIYGNHPYAHSPDGTVESVQSMTREAVLSFYQQFYVAGNSDVVIVGDVSRDQANAIAEKVLGSLPEGHAAPKLSAAVNSTHADQRFIPFSAQQNTIILGEIGITPTDKEYFPLIVGNRILGGLPLSSLLFNQVRNQRGLAYGVYSQFQPLLYRGPFLIVLQTRTDRAKQALQMTQEILQNFVKNGPTQEQKNAAQQNMVGSFPLGISTNADILSSVATIAFYHLPLDYLNTYVQKVQSVTADQIREAFQATVHPNIMKIMVVGQDNKQSSVKN